MTVEVPVERSARVAAIDAVLPQTQCRQCGFDGCRPYAAAIARDEADIDRCPPGGDAGVLRLSAVTGRPVRPLDPTRGATKPLVLAVIDEAICIGCTLCIQACPVDAIVGGARRMHAVVGDLCTGCELCVAPCPVDCIAMVDAGFGWTDAHAAAARDHHDRRVDRLARWASEAADRREAVCRTPVVDAPDRKAAIVAAAVARAARLAAERRPVRGPS